MQRHPIANASVLSQQPGNTQTLRQTASTVTQGRLDGHPSVFVWRFADAARLLVWPLVPTPVVGVQPGDDLLHGEFGSDHEYAQAIASASEYSRGDSALPSAQGSGQKLNQSNAPESDMIGPKNAISVILIQDSIDARTSCPAVEKRILCEFAMRSNAESEVRHRLDAILSLDP